jgi:hypothetical protein
MPFHEGSPVAKQSAPRSLYPFTERNSVDLHRRACAGFSFAHEEILFVLIRAYPC